MRTSFIETFFLYWFIATLLAVTSAIGVVLGVVNSITLVITAGALFVAELTVFLWLHPGSNRKKDVQIIILLFFFLTGIAVGKLYTDPIRYWLRGSVLETIDLINPLTYHYGKPAEKISEEDMEALQDLYSELTLYDHPIKNPLLVSFSKLGLVIIKDRKPTFLDKEWSLLTHLDPSTNTLLYYNKEGRQSLHKSTIVNGVLEREWSSAASSLYLHHWGDVYENRVFQPGKIFFHPDLKFAHMVGGKYKSCVGRSSVNETIEIFDYTSGAHLDTIPILEIMAQFKSLGKKNPMNYFGKCTDTTHLNSIRVIKTEAHADAFPNAQVGDLILSLRNIHAIILLDKDTYEIKWHLDGRENKAFAMQHSPRMTKQNTMILFDNKGSNPENGRSRIIEVDPMTKEFTVLYKETGEGFFFSDEMGKVQQYGKYYIVQDHDIENNPLDKVALFLLDCSEKTPEGYCKRLPIFEGTHPFKYDNIAILNGEVD